MKHKIGFFIRLFIAMSQSLVIDILQDLIVLVLTNSFITRRFKPINVGWSKWNKVCVMLL